MQGYIKLYRKLKANPIATNANVLGLFCYLLLAVNHSPNDFYIGTKKINLKAGQAVISQKKLAEHFQVSGSTVHSRMKMLKQEGIISIATNNKYSLLSIIKRKQYQFCENCPNTHRNQTESKPNSDQKPVETNNNDKKDGNEKKKEASVHLIKSLLENIQKTADELDVIYDGTEDHHNGQMICENVQFGKLCEKQNLSPTQLACKIMRTSAQINFRKGICAGPKAIRQNYAEVLNKAKSLNRDEIDNFILKQSPEIKEKLFVIKKMRAEQFPYKPPFSNIDHVKTFIAAIENGEF